MTERDLIELIQNLARNEGEGLIRGIGDDCAVIAKDRHDVWLLTMDTLIESVHFDNSWHPPYLLGRKAVSVNVSDIAAMGGKPVFALLSLGLPADFAPEWATELSRGINDACRQYGCLLIGGSGKVAGTSVGKRENVGIPTEYPLELAPCIKAHLDPEARVDLARSLARTGCIHAMMDLSDGLATDLSHLCQQSRVGARIEAEKLPGRKGLTPAALLLEKKRTDWMIAGGEDYELLFTADPKDSDTILSAAEEQGVRVSPVGIIRTGQGVTLRKATADGHEEQPVSFQGFDHFAGN